MAAQHTKKRRRDPARQAARDDMIDPTFRKIVESASQGILVHRQFKALYVNNAYCQIFGRSHPDEILTMPTILGLFDVPDRDRLKQYHLDRLAGNPAPADYVIRGLLPNGEVVWLNNRPFVVDWHGEPAVCQVMMDISETVFLKTAHDRMVSAITDLPDAVILFDPGDRFIFSNTQFQRIPGGGAISTSGTRYQEYLQWAVDTGDLVAANSDPAGWIQQRLDMHALGSCTHHLELTEDRWVDIHEYKMEDGGTLIVHRDITGQKRAEKKRMETETYFRAIFDNSSSVAYLKDPQGRFLIVNRTFHAWNRSSDDAVIGKTAFDLNAHAVADNIRDSESRVLRSGSSQTGEYAGVFPDGVHRTTLVHRFPIIDVNGTITGVGGFETDISEHKRAQQSLRQKTDLFNTVLDNLPIGINVKDGKGRYLIANKQLHQWRGVEDGSFFYRRTEDMFAESEEVRHARQRQEARVRTELTVVTREEYRDCGDGVTRYFEWTKFPIFSEPGELGAIGTIGIDISERKAVEKNLLNAKELAEIASRAKSEFLAHMSHELRTPLNAIIGFSQMMQAELFGELGHPSYRDYTGDILASGTHLLNVINDILDISKIEAGELELSESKVDVMSLISSTFKMLQSRADLAEITLVTNSTASTPRLQGDELRLKQVLLNLMTNAIKFTPKSGQVTVSVQTADDGDMIWYVSDTGIGISATDIERVLKPFEQAREGSLLSHEGTGLGLYLSQSLAKLHGGLLTIESEPRVGTTVSIRFPQSRVVPVRTLPVNA